MRLLAIAIVSGSLGLIGTLPAVFEASRQWHVGRFRFCRDCVGGWYSASQLIYETTRSVATDAIGMLVPSHSTTLPQPR